MFILIEARDKESAEMAKHSLPKTANFKPGEILFIHDECFRLEAEVPDKTNLKVLLSTLRRFIYGVRHILLAETPKGIKT
jgi:hypothetical protein